MGAIYSNDNDLALLPHGCAWVDLGYLEGPYRVVVHTLMPPNAMADRVGSPSPWPYPSAPVCPLVRATAIPPGPTPLEGRRCPGARFPCRVFTAA